MLSIPIFGKDVFIGYNLDQVRSWTLVYDINYLEDIPSLKDENGETIYPTTLYKQGKWTWSAFADYMEKVKTYYATKPNPSRPENTIYAYVGEFREMTQLMLHTAGQAIYGRNGLQVDTPETVQAVAFVQQLIENGLYVAPLDTDGYTPNGRINVDIFREGGAVFTDMPDYSALECGQALSARGHSMGLVPYPRPDWMEPGDSRYQMLTETGDGYGVLKGISTEQTRLALETLKLYYQTRYRTMAGSDKSLDYLTTTAQQNALAHGYDIFHKKIGADILDIYAHWSPSMPTEAAKPMGVYYLFSSDILGQALFHYENSPEFSVAIKQKMSILDTRLNEMKAALGL